MSRLAGPTPSNTTATQPIILNVTRADTGQTLFQYELSPDLVAALDNTAQDLDLSLNQHLGNAVQFRFYDLPIVAEGCKIPSRTTLPS